MNNQIAPHGGKLVNRLVTDNEAQEIKDRAKHLPKITLEPQAVSDLEMLAIGGYSPLEGFMGSKDYRAVIEHKHLANGLVWPIPIVIGVASQTTGQIKEGKDAAFVDTAGGLLGLICVEELFSADKDKEALLVYGTKESKHPGVERVYQRPDMLVAGKVSVLSDAYKEEYLEYELTPTQTREAFQKRGWRRIVGFQTRNPVHRAHEYIQKCALEMVDGLLLHPIIGETKGDDIPAHIRMECYKVLLEKYYPKDQVMLVVNPMSMRYAGPREAILHAIVRKNYGCTHFIVGRDHAGVGNYYGPFDAQKIFDEFKPEELGIIPLFFDNAAWCHKCGNMVSLKTCPHSAHEHLSLSGTKVREMLSKGEFPPPEFTRPEVAEILLHWYQHKDK